MNAVFRRAARALGTHGLVTCVLACGVWADTGELVPGGDFEAGLEAWTSVAGTPVGAFREVIGPAGGPGGLAAGCEVGPAELARLERRVPVAPGAFVDRAPDPGRPGARVQLGAWVLLDALAVSGGEVWLEVLATDGSSESLLAESPRLVAGSAPADRWHFLATEVAAGSAGRVTSGTVELRYRLCSSVEGLVMFDGARVRAADREELELLDADFEGWFPGSPGWIPIGGVGPASGWGHTGQGSAHLAPGAWLEQVVALGPAPQEPFPPLAPGELPEAGVWLHLETELGLPTSPHPSFRVDIEVHALDPAQPLVERLVARGRWNPSVQDARRWRYLETEPIGQGLAAGESRLRVRLRNTTATPLRADSVQLGERSGVDGHRRLRVGASYVGRYRSPLYPGATTEPTTAAERWRNWHWQEPTACDPTFAGFFHSPDCATSPTCLRPDGRRDVAVTLEGGAPTPLAGAYDSRDPDVLRLHLELARSAGVDHFVYEWLGERLGVQELSYGREPINHQTLEALLAAAEEPGQDVKVAVMYEPKSHLLGWVQGQPTLAEKLTGIVADLTWLAERARGSRGVLRSDGRLVVFVFRVFGCDPSLTQCLDEAAWQGIHAAVLQATGEDLLLVSDAAPAADSALDGFTRWRLVAPELLRYRTFAEAAAGIPSFPAPTLAALEAHVEALAREVSDWGAEDEDLRRSVLTVWPGFDDTGVGGWASGNLTGDDGAPLCVRVLDDLDGMAYGTTVAAAFDHGFEWVQIATWNDWNEDTRIEPAWHADLLAPVPVGSPPPAAVTDHAFGRLLETRQWISAFKGEDPRGPGPRAIALRYLSRARRLPGVVLYD